MTSTIEVTPEFLTVTKLEPEERSSRMLYQLIKEDDGNIMQSGQYSLAFWKRLFLPLSACVMMLLAIPFIFGPMRSSTIGSRLLIGVSIGFSFYILNQFFGPISLVYQFPPILAAAMPTILFALMAMILIRRAR